MTTLAGAGRGRGVRNAASGLVLLLITAAFLVPFLWLIFASVDPNAGLALRIPSEISLANFKEILTTETTLRPFVNGFVISGGTALLTVVLGALAAYPLSRHRFPFKRSFMLGMLFSTGLPATGMIFPIYGMFVNAGFLDSQVALIFLLSAGSLPFAIWVLKNFMDAVPREIEEAAWVDGASPMTALRSVVLPLMLPGLSVVGIFTFLLAWGNFLLPFILLVSDSKQPAAVAIYQFFSQHGFIEFGPLAAYSMLYSLPVILLYVAVSKHMGSAFNLGGALQG